MKEINPIEMRDIIDNLVQKYGIDAVEITINSILNFYHQNEEDA